MENRSKNQQMFIRRIVSKYQIGQMLGSGAYSQVFKAKHLEQGGTYAIKVISNQSLAENVKVKQGISNQLAVHNVMEQHQNIVHFVQLLQTKNNCYFVYEYCQGGTLQDVLKKDGAIQELKAIQIFLQLVQGLKILRKHNIMHRDLKPQNVFIKEGHYKLGDFAFCKELQDQNMTNTMLGSPLYMAPQVLRGQAYSIGADIWSMGVMLYQMIYGHCPFQSSSIAALISTIDECSINYDSSKFVSNKIKNFIKKCLQKDCKQRITWQQFFKEAYNLQENSNSNSRLFIPRGGSQIMKYSSNFLSSQLQVPAQNSELKPTHSQSKYELYKQNFSKFNDVSKLKPEFNNKNNLKIFQSNNQKIRNISICTKKEQLSLVTKTHKHLKLSYNQMVEKHQNCSNLLQNTLQSIETANSNTFPKLQEILKSVKSQLQQIYDSINLEDTQMLAMLSIVKYELIQIDKFIQQLRTVFPLPKQNRHQLKHNMPTRLSQMI